MGVALVVSIRLYTLILVPLFFATLVPFVHPAFAQEEGQYINRRVEIWGLFYKFMSAAFVVGAAVQGVILFIVLRFREKKARVGEVQA